MQNYSTVYSAWDGEKLVGFDFSVMDDGIMTATFTILLVDPDYQYNGIGKRIDRTCTDKTYQSYLRISLIANGNNVGLYENCEFKIDKREFMHITSSC